MLTAMQDLDLRGQRVFIREDLNVPISSGRIANAARIAAALPTLITALEQNARVMVVSHLGRPQEGQYEDAYSLAPIADYLAQQLPYPVNFAPNWIDGVTVAPGQLTVCENVRFLIGEKTNDEHLARKMAELCDIFVMDAFAAAHRKHASTYGVAKFASKAVAGPLLLAEINALNLTLDNPKRPLLAVVGGAKVSSKLALLQRIANIVDVLIVGGGIANTFLAAQGYAVGKSLYEPELIPMAKQIIAQASAEIGLIQDVIVAEEIEENALAVGKAITEVEPSDRILDIGPKTIRNYANYIQQAETIIWNGPVGVFELAQFSAGTRALAVEIANSKAFSLAGGGDTIAAIEQFGIYDAISYISTGGGAFLQYLQDKTLPGIEVLR